MTQEQKMDLILKELTSINWKVDSIDTRLSSVETKMDSMEVKIDSIDNRLTSLEDKVEYLKEEFMSFKNQTDDNFDYTNKLINQAFEKINENISYQDKVSQIERIIHSRNKQFA